MVKKSTYILVVFMIISLGRVYAQNLPQATIDNYLAQADKYLAEDNKNTAISLYNKAAILYWENGVNNKAIEIFKKSLPLVESLENKNGIRTIHNYLGSIYTDINDLNNALTHFKKAVEVSRLMKNNEKLIESLNNLAITQKNLKQNNEAIATLKESLGFALELKNNQKTIRSCYYELAENYEALGDMANWKFYTDLFNTFNAYVMASEKLELEKKQAVAFAQATAARLKLKLEQAHLALARDSLDTAEKLTKEQIMKIEMLNLAKENDSLKIKEKESALQKASREKYILFGIIAFILLIFVLLFVQFSQKKKANKLLAEKNDLLEVQKNEISMKNLTLRDLNSTLKRQKEEIEKSNLELEGLNKELAYKNNQIEQSIIYASKIQEAILPSQKAISYNFPNSFIFYRPRDIVSGDFYWFSEKNNKQVIAAVDCTGHSVPGAFMSMIGNTLLNEIVNEKHLLEPAVILDKLHEGIVTTLNQNGDNEQKDGMDITLCVIDKQAKTLEIAAANHSVLIITNNNLQEIEGDIFSIGDEFLLMKKTNFTNHKLILEKDTNLYLMSDGYQDQFGGERNSKFMKMNLKNLLLENQHLKMREQGDLLMKTFDEWKGNRKQIDDVLLIGLRIEIE